MIRDWVELNMTPGIGPRAAAKLLERFGSAGAVYSATRAELEQLRLAPEAVDAIIGRELQARAETEIDEIRKLGGDILLLDDGVYPSSLREIYDPPLVAVDNARFTVYDGNRRITCLKLIIDPRRAPSQGAALPPPW